MPDKIILDRLNAIAEHIATIEERMAGVSIAEDFRTKEGSVIFDAILIRLQALGENIKKIESLQPGFVDQKLSIDVDNIIRFRDIISHHYEKLDTEIIYNIIQNQIPTLKNAVINHISGSNLLMKLTPRLIEKKSIKPRGRRL